ncbi:hypothetical protein [Streptomyces albidoflavus]|uniref:hypothetical protein n=1 Tax=Streptomyces albidoflavus TaxID=1886 RepID=UPI00211BD9F9|nr:hypothetical protein [Streptomyces albidoflavus]
MPDRVPVRCPACRRDHQYVPAAYPCRCGAAVVPPPALGAPARQLVHRVWEDSWITVRCGACGRQDRWPRPELDCSCGAVLALPVLSVPQAAGRGQPEAARHGSAPAWDPVALAVHWLEGLGHREVRRMERRGASAVGLRASGVLAEVETAVRPVGARTVECLWLSGLAAGLPAVHFARAGYTAGLRVVTTSTARPRAVAGPVGV